MASKILLGIIIFISSTMCHSEEGKCVCDEVCEGRGLTEIPQCLHGSIKDIRVSRNNITKIVPLTLFMYDSLESIDVSYNKLSALENGTFQFVPNVCQIKLRRNLIETISEDVLKPLQKLETFSVSENSIEEISEIMFDRNVNLKSLYLYRNKLSRLGKNLFKNLRKLQRLNFSNNRISSLHVEIFRGNPSLKELFMAYNRIDHMDAGLFEHNARLEYLDISGNDLVVLEAGIFQLNRKLGTVVMSDNPWNCNCLMKTTLMDLSGRNIELDNVGKCWTPEGIGDLSGLLETNISCQASEMKPNAAGEQDSDKFQFCDDTNYTMVIVGGFIIILAQIMICFIFSFHRYIVPKKTEDAKMSSLKRRSANCYSYEIPANVTNKHGNNQNDYNYIVPTPSENVYACISETDNRYLTMIGYDKICLPRPPPPPPTTTQEQAEDVYTVMKSQNVSLDNKYLTLDGKFTRYENVS